MAKLRHGSTAALAIMLDSVSWTSVAPGVLAAEQDRLTETAQILRRAGWGVVTVTRGEHLATVWERLGIHRARRLVPAPAAAGDDEGDELGGVA